MKKKKIFNKIFVLVSVSILTILGIINAYATDNVAYYDNLFSSNNFTINTDIEINDEQSFRDVIYRTVGNFGMSDYWNSQDDYAYLNLTLGECNYDDRMCDFGLYREKNENGEWTSDLVKNYENISILINSNIASDFNMVNNSGNVIINYDESMFETDEEKENYIRTYFNNLQENNNNTHYYYNYDFDNKSLTRVESVNGKTTRVSVKRINNIIFEYSEDPYSNEFKKLTANNTLTIKIDSDITKELLSRHLNTYNMGSSYFSIDGEITNNKVYIKRSEYTNGQSVEKEKHLITLVKDENIDLSLFNRVGYQTSANIQADAPTNPYNKRNYIQNFFSMTHFQTNYEDNSYDYYDEITSYDNYESVTIQYKKANSQGGIIDIQYHVIPVNFVGYSNEVSNKYSNAVKGKVVINADSLSLETINSNISYPLRALACNDDFSMCDIAYDHYDDQIIEIHKAAIELSNELSDDFKKAFKIKEDGSIDIIKENDVELSYGSIYYSYYDEKTGNSLSFNCMNNNKCNLSLRNYSKNISESHTIPYNLVNKKPTSSYLSLVKQSIDIYPGELEEVWNTLRYSYSFFSKKAYSSNVKTDYCDSEKSKCSVITLNSDNIVEIHNSKVNIKEGKSPIFNELFPGETINIPSVYKDDEEYLYKVSMAYLMSKTKTWSYLQDFSNGKAKVLYDGFEKHTMNIEFEDANQEHQQEVNQALAKLANQNLDVTMDDMEYVNSFYYEDPNQPAAANFNSKSLDEKLSKLIDNKHIGYFFVEEGGLGNLFFNEVGGNVALFYDGVAYGITNSMLRASKKHIIYIPDNTENSTEAYVKAAQKRIDDYLGKNSGVTIKYEGIMDYIDVGEDVLDEELFDGKTYLLTYKEKEDLVLIVKDSSKMKTSTFNATDVNSNIKVSSDNANYPTNTIVSSEQYNNNQYKDVLEKLGLKDAQIVDINLYSPSIGNIDNFENVNFDVDVPINLEGYEGKKLYAYYIREDGSIEEHPITLDDFVGNFETDHFSTYIISEKVDDKILAKYNPNTGDNIINYVIMAIVGATGLIIIKKRISKSN